MEVEKNIKRLEESGAAEGELATNAWKAVERWKGLAAMSNVEFGDFRCFKGGCAVTSTHQDVASAAAAGQAVLYRDPQTGWPGGMFRSGPLQAASGKVQLVWILYSKPTL